MTFGEHLEELRRRLIFGLIAFAVAFAAAFVFQEELMSFFSQPYERARAAINETLVKEWASRQHPQTGVARTVDRILDELEKRKLFDESTMAELRKLAAKEREEQPPRLEKLQAIGTVEKFSAYMMECLLAALVISAPILLWELWKYVAAGLYEHERRVVLGVLPWSLLLFFVGLAFGYFVLAELSVRFLVGYGSFEHVIPQVTISSYLGILLLLLLVMGLVFQIPLLMSVLASVGLTSPEFFRKKRRHFILAIFVVAAIITPPDYISQLLVAGPMLVLFELGIWLAAGAAKKRKSKDKDKVRDKDKDAKQQ
jgi:sec-independent protein translocase protein TatC